MDTTKIMIEPADEKGEFTRITIDKGGDPEEVVELYTAWSVGDVTEKLTENIRWEVDAFAEQWV